MWASELKKLHNFHILWVALETCPLPGLRQPGRVARLFTTQPKIAHSRYLFFFYLRVSHFCKSWLTAAW